MDGATAARFDVGIAGAGVLANAVPRATVAAINLRVMGDTPFPLWRTNEERRSKFRSICERHFSVNFRCASRLYNQLTISPPPLLPSPLRLRVLSAEPR